MTDENQDRLLLVIPDRPDSATSRAGADRNQNLGTPTQIERTTAMSTATFTVTGMTCGHCVNSVTEEVSQVPGITEVNVDLASGGLTVTSTDGVDDAAVRAAVEEAGYKVAAPAGQASPAPGQTSGCGCGCS